MNAKSKFFLLILLTGVFLPFENVISNIGTKMLIDSFNYSFEVERTSNLNDPNDNNVMIAQSKGYKRTYRDYFESTSAIHEFLANHTFIASDGSRLRYRMGDLRIEYPGNILQFTNIKVLSFNKDIARVQAMWIKNGMAITVVVNSKNGTVSDGETTFFAQ